MRIVCGQVVYVYLTRLILGPNIAFPEIAMYQAGFDLPPIGFESIKQSWDNRAGDYLECLRKFRPYSVGSNIVIVCAGQEFRVKFCPVAVPFDIVRQLSIVRLDVKAKFAIWRDALVVELGDQSA